MKKLYTPWRSEYATSVDSKTKNSSTTEQDCTFCIAFAANDDTANFIIRRFEHNVVILNLYPYNVGHMMVIPLKHHARLADLSKEARTELMELTSHCSTIAQEVLNAHGVNVGINIGKAAGAGIPAHLHLHVLPRWEGDTNFMPLLAETKILSFDLKEMYKKLKPRIDQITL